MVRAHYTKKGITFNLLCRVTRIDATEIEAGKTGGKVHFTDIDGREHTVTGEKVLISVGRRPTTTGFGLETLGVALNDRRGIAVDEQMRTNIPGVYAAGDVTALSMLAHTASRQAEVAVNNMAGTPDTMRYDAIPGVVYTNPEVASVGLTYDAARARGLAVRELSLPMSYSGRFVAETVCGDGICKVVITADPSFEDDAAASALSATSVGPLGTDVASDGAPLVPGQVVGVHLFGNPAGEIIWGAALAIEQRMTLPELQRIIFPHPTVAEVIKETLFTV
jgi:dihydrolipoamide dehydrogenase